MGRKLQPWRWVVLFELTRQACWLEKGILPCEALLAQTPRELLRAFSPGSVWLALWALLWQERPSEILSSATGDCVVQSDPKLCYPSKWTSEGALAGSGPSCTNRNLWCNTWLSVVCIWFLWSFMWDSECCLELSILSCPSESALPELCVCLSLPATPLLTVLYSEQGQLECIPESYVKFPSGEIVLVTLVFLTTADLLLWLCMKCLRNVSWVWKLIGLSETCTC